ncbi:regulatory signaling modulator protein AmpE [Halopseudomonas oceani]|uniref:regulatory signaling modulator protein AmpE n=1 Tax=Halopseudomonas oceani TaxID=1708783 RepID=UPI002AA8AD83|nr:regulatory signaling modulator protein AmpE [Halopseudomonas oceani]
MHFLALLLVVVLMWLTPLRTGLPLDLPKYWVGLVVRHGGGQARIGGVLLVLLPVLLLVLLQWWLQRNGLGFFGLLLFALVLLACVGRQDPLGELAAGFERAWARGDEAAAALVAEQDLGVVAEGEQSVLAEVRAVLVREMLHGYVVTVFWFALLGPVGALGYRLLRVLADASGTNAAGPAAALVHALEWIPARLLAASFALVGHFDHVRAVLENVLFSWDVPSDELIHSAAEAALQGGSQRLADAGDEGVLADTRTLLVRALMVWAVVLALLAVLG